MSETKVLRYTDDVYDEPIAIIGLPSIGLVGSILGNLIVRELKMSVIAAIVSPDLPPYCMIQNGTPYPPMRVYGCARETKDDKCGSIVVVTSEVAPKPEQCFEITYALMDLFNELGVKKIIALEGVPPFDDKRTMMACGSSEAVRKTIEELEIHRLDEGLVRGVTGIMLYEGYRTGVDVMSILCAANPALPDPKAAASLIEPLSKIIPELKIDPTPLYKEAEEIESRVKSQEEYNNKDSTDIRQLYG
ncbi:MAG: PAC2 family protein [Candidatus Methanoplasma sp.]|jgi:uncharacterized protein|nr:PAC2 family protein [Candidatus Methanoplasma sp.]